MYPDRRLLRALAAWTGAALLAVALPALVPGVVLGLVALLALVALDALALARHPAVRLERHLPERAALGRGAQARLVVSNPGDDPVEIDVYEDLPRDVAPVDPAFRGVRVPAGGERALAYALVPRSRGDRLLGPPVALRRSGLGFLRRRTTGRADDVLRVYPDATRFLRREALDPKRVLAALGIRSARHRGEGMDFDALREYVPGDDPRRIDWRATARRGRPITRLYRHEPNHTVMIAVDASRLMGARAGGASKLDAAVDAALALVYASLSHGDRVGLVVFDREVRGFAAPRSGRESLGAFIELLRPVQPRLVEPDYEVLVRALAVRQRQRALVVVLTDFVEAAPAGLVTPLRVLARRHRTLLVALRDRLFEDLAPGAAGDDAHALYRRLVLDDLLRDRELALARLRRHNVQTLDLPPERVVAPLLNRYLEIRFGEER